MRRRTPAPLAYVLHKPRHRVSVLARVLPVPEPSQGDPIWPIWSTPAIPPPQAAICHAAGCPAPPLPAPILYDRSIRDQRPKLDSI